MLASWWFRAAVLTALAVASITLALSFGSATRQSLPQPSTPVAAVRPADPTRVKLFSGNELCAFTWTGKPGLIAVTSSSGTDEAQGIYQTCVHDACEEHVQSRAGTPPVVATPFPE